MSRPGALNRRVELWRDTTGQGNFGEPQPAWALIGSRWASIMPGASRGVGAERYAQDAERSTQAVVITVRYDELTKTLDPKDRIRYDGTDEYDVVSVSDLDTAHRYVEILAKHRSPETDRLP